MASHYPTVSGSPDPFLLNEAIPPYPGTPVLTATAPVFVPQQSSQPALAGSEETADSQLPPSVVITPDVNPNPYEVQTFYSRRTEPAQGPFYNFEAPPEYQPTFAKEALRRALIWKSASYPRTPVQTWGVHLDDPHSVLFPDPVRHLNRMAIEILDHYKVGPAWTRVCGRLSVHAIERTPWPTPTILITVPIAGQEDILRDALWDIGLFTHLISDLPCVNIEMVDPAYEFQPQIEPVSTAGGNNGHRNSGHDGHDGNDGNGNGNCGDDRGSAKSKTRPSKSNSARSLLGPTLDEFKPSTSSPNSPSETLDAPSDESTASSSASLDNLAALGASVAEYALRSPPPLPSPSLSPSPGPSSLASSRPLSLFSEVEPIDSSLSSSSSHPPPPSFPSQTSLPPPPPPVPAAAAAAAVIPSPPAQSSVDSPHKKTKRGCRGGRGARARQEKARLRDQMIQDSKAKGVCDKGKQPQQGTAKAKPQHKKGSAVQGKQKQTPQKQQAQQPQPQPQQQKQSPVAEEPPKAGPTPWWRERQKKRKAQKEAAARRVSAQ
ncbi:hypothetical protein BJY04DRAFT_222387 [Aspergillus karnatakaensis]|uniref:uncharacterized protein n=1 Tax=Aspergillus karnatakaensis TaxID=1810916 RepID=UPI003CCE153D